VTAKEKLLKRLLATPTDFTHDELTRLLAGYGYREDTGGKTSGSLVHFIGDDGSSITIHKPHRGNAVKRPYLRAIIEHLRKQGHIK
jgi:peptidoglycan/xylan/chitin deacetylase (PgdA/CDA1 family)